MKTAKGNGGLAFPRCINAPVSSLRCKSAYQRLRSWHTDVHTNQCSASLNSDLDRGTCKASDVHSLFSGQQQLKWKKKTLLYFVYVPNTKTARAQIGVWANFDCDDERTGTGSYRCRCRQCQAWSCKYAINTYTQLMCISSVIHLPHFHLHAWMLSTCPPLTGT